MTLTKVLPVVAGGVGASVAVQDLGAKKVIVVDGVTGSIVVEASADGVVFCPVATFAPTDSDKTVVAPAGFMRVRATSGNAAGVQVVAEAGLVRTGTIPAPPTNGPGAALDVTSFGCLSTVFVGPLTGGGSINIEISPDGIDWTQDFKTFITQGCDTKEVPARFVRAVGVGATASVSFASEEPASASLTQPVATIVYRPGATGADAPGGNVYTTWAGVMGAIDATRGLGIRYLEFDNRFAPPSPTGAPASGGFNPAIIPAGVWDMSDVIWIDAQLVGGGGNMAVEFADGCQILALGRIQMFIATFWFNGTSGVPVFSFELISPVAGYQPLRLEGVVCRFMTSNPLATPMMRLDGAVAAMVWSAVTNLGGLGGSGFTPSPAPIIDVNGNYLILLMNGGMVYDNVFTGDGFIDVRIQGPAADGNRFFYNNANWSNPAFIGTYLPALFQEITARRYVEQTLAAPGSMTIGDIQPVDTTGGALQVDLPSAAIPARLGAIVTVKDVGGAAGANPITVAVPLGENLDGVLNGTFAIATNFGYQSFYMDGFGGWWTI